MSQKKRLPLQVNILSVILGIIFCGTQTFAQEMTVLALQGPGQGSVAIDLAKKVAYIIDLGKDGDGDKILLENVPLLDRLASLEIKRLVFTCSHPHADHMGGIRALFANPRNFFNDDSLTVPRFESITVIDDGVSNSLFSILNRSIPKNLITLQHLSASNVNAFAKLSQSEDAIFIENIPYKIAGKASPHGRSVVTRIVLGGKYSVLDFDDADTATIRKVVDTLKKRGTTEISSFVVPHHGSAYHDIKPILELNPKQAIITVNPKNRYGHPSPSILHTLMDRLEPKNVLFTGSLEHITLNTEGVKYGHLQRHTGIVMRSLSYPIG